MLLVDHHQAQVVEHHVVLDERMGADHQRVLPGRQPLQDLAPGPAPRAPSSSRGERPWGESSASRVTQCWRARISVGAITTHWWPERQVIRAAMAATAVLPLPTSPWSRRFIGPGAARSASTWWAAIR